MLINERSAIVTVLDRPRRPRPQHRDESPPPSRNWIVMWVVTVVLLVGAIALAVTTGQRVDENDAPENYPGVVSAENVETP